MKNDNLLPNESMNIDDNCPKYKTTNIRRFNELIDENYKLNKNINILYVGASQFSNTDDSACSLTEIGEICGLKLYELTNRKFYTYELNENGYLPTIHLIGIVEE